MKNDGLYAFPFDVTGKDGLRFRCPGMTMRDFFAAAALQGELAQSSEGAWREESFHILAERCFRAADALLAERAK